MIGAGIPPMGVIIGFLRVPFGVWLAYKGLQVKNAIAMINQTPPGEAEAAA